MFLFAFFFFCKFEQCRILDLHCKIMYRNYFNSIFLKLLDFWRRLPCKAAFAEGLPYYKCMKWTDYLQLFVAPCPLGDYTLLWIKSSVVLVFKQFYFFWATQFCKSISQNTDQPFSKFWQKILNRCFTGWIRKCFVYSISDKSVTFASTTLIKIFYV